MSLESLIVLAVTISVVAMLLVRQRRVYSAYMAAQRQVMDRQVEAMALQREMLDQQKEMVRLLTRIAGSN